MSQLLALLIFCSTNNKLCFCVKMCLLIIHIRPCTLSFAIQNIFSLNLLHSYAAAAKSLQSCPTLCDPIDSPPGSSVPGILQARTLEWVAISFSNAWKWKVKVKSLSHVRLFATPWTAAYQAPGGPWDFSGRSTGVGCHCLLHTLLLVLIKSSD